MFNVLDLLIRQPDGPHVCEVRKHDNTVCTSLLQVELRVSNAMGLLGLLFICLAGIPPGSEVAHGMLGNGSIVVDRYTFTCCL